MLQISDHAWDRIFAIAAMVISPAASLLLARWANRRDRERGEGRANRHDERDEFAEHREAFKLRIDQLEERISELERELLEAEEDRERYRQERDQSYQNAWRIQGELDRCRETLARKDA